MIESFTFLDFLFASFTEVSFWISYMFLVVCTGYCRVQSDEMFCRF